jgi:hypothetical protein
MEDHGVHGMDAQALLGFFFFICLRTLRTVALFMMSYPVSRVNRFAFNPLALAALVSVLCGLQQISQTSSSSLLASDSALPCWEIATSDVATHSVTCEDESTDSLADEDGEATDSATGDEGATDSVTSEDASTDSLTDEDVATDSATGDEIELDIT